jgi:glucose/arabinose dehydrogenase
MRKITLLLAWFATTIAFVLLGASSALAQGVQLVPFGQPTYASPYYVTGEPGDPSRVYVVEGAGRIRLVINGTPQAGYFLDINGDVCFSSDSPSCGGESGMFSIAFAPDYATTGLFYVFYTRNDTTPGNHHFLVIREFRRTTDPNDINEATGRDVLVIPHPSASNHNGGQLQFGPDGYLYISTGDGGNTPQNGQSRTTLLGKILRIDPGGSNPGEYTVPPDNPYVAPDPNADEIYSYGLRNPYRFSFDRLTGDLAIGDVGEGSREEADLVTSGAGGGVNFGWACYEGTLVHSTSGLCDPLPANHTPPVLEYPHSGSAAISGGYVVRDETLPSLLGRYLYADTFDSLGGEIYSAALTPGVTTTGTSTGLTATNVGSFGEDACGHVYVAEIGGAVSRIQPSPATPACHPQIAPSLPAGSETSGPILTVDPSKARRAASRGEVTLVVRCDESCTVRGTGRIVLPGRDIGIDPDSVSLPAGLPGALHLDLSGKESKRLRAALLDREKAKAKVELSATDAAGNLSAVERRIRQKP